MTFKMKYALANGWYKAVNFYKLKAFHHLHYPIKYYDESSIPGCILSRGTKMSVSGKSSGIGSALTIAEKSVLLAGVVDTWPAGDGWRIAWPKLIWVALVATAVVVTTADAAALFAANWLSGSFTGTLKLYFT